MQVETAVMSSRPFDSHDGPSTIKQLQKKWVRDASGGWMADSRKKSVKFEKPQEDVTITKTREMLDSFKKSKKKKAEKGEKKKKKSKSTTKSSTTTTKSTSSRSKSKSASSATTPWNFGRPKQPITHPKRQIYAKSAVTIQRCVRGWWQRLQYKILKLEHALLTKDDRTQEAVARVHDRVNKQKEIIQQKLENAHRRELNKQTREETTAQEGQQVIAFLRKENKKLREKNTKIYTAICALKLNNERLEQANDKSGSSMNTLNDHAKQINETHDKLQDVVPKYKESVDVMKDAVEIRRQYCLSEHKIKVMYQKCMGTVIELVENSCNDPKLVNEVVEYCLELENQELNTSPLPKELTEDDMKNDTQHSADSDNYDDYTIASMD